MPKTTFALLFLAGALTGVQRFHDRFPVYAEIPIAQLSSAEVRPGRAKEDAW